MAVWRDDGYEEVGEAFAWSGLVLLMRYRVRSRTALSSSSTYTGKLRHLPITETSAEMQSSVDDVVSLTLTQYSLLPFVPQPGKYTVLASFVLHNPATQQSGRGTTTHLLSLGTGVKCLPASRLPPLGDALHDSHAEVIARRGAIRWFLEEVQRDVQAPGSSEWICARKQDGLYTLRNDVQLWMYASTVPCASPPQLSTFSVFSKKKKNYFLFILVR
jgi:Adenosine-deaminase (editase) domain